MADVTDMFVISMVGHKFHAYDNWKFVMQSNLEPCLWACEDQTPEW
jgi:hypothetical protein